MRHPHHTCGACGERLYGHVDGGSFCANCGERREESDDGGRRPVLAA